MAKKRKQAPQVVRPVSREMQPQPYNAAILDTMKLDFSPGNPFPAMPGINPSGPRQWQYIPGTNMDPLPRDSEDYSFEVLRRFAESLDAVAICIGKWQTLSSKLKLVVKPRPELLENDEDIDQYKDDIRGYEKFFAKPDGQTRLGDWIRKAIYDQLSIDAVAIYVRRALDGTVLGLDLVDGATIKPILDDRGRVPDPPFAAYQQVINGAVAGNYRADELLYVVENPRTNSRYGRSRVERFILRANQALRKQNRDLFQFTDGVRPDAVITSPLDDKIDPKDLQTWESMFNAGFGGNDKRRAGAKVMMPGTAYNPLPPVEISPAFDEFLLEIACSAFDLNPAELGMTKNVNRATGESQENVLYRGTLEPLAKRYAELFTDIIENYFDDDRFIVAWEGYEEADDFKSKAHAFAELVKVGIISGSDAARELKLPVQELNKPAQETMGGPVALLPNGTKEVLPETDAEDDEEDGDEDEAPIMSRSTDWKRYRERCLQDIKRQRPFRSFTSDVIPQYDLLFVQQHLETCQTTEDVKRIFQMQRDIENYIQFTRGPRSHPATPREVSR